MNSIQDIANFLKRNGARPKPLSDNQITIIEDKYKIILPAVYKKFLKLMGGGAGFFMLGSSVFYNELFSLKQGTEELISENNLPPLPENAFVFFMHQGYQAAYFKLDEGDDPLVYYYSEGGQSQEFSLMTNTLTDFFLAHLEDVL